MVSTQQPLPAVPGDYLSLSLSLSQSLSISLYLSISPSLYLSLYLSLSSSLPLSILLGPTPPSPQQSAISLAHTINPPSTTYSDLPTLSEQNRQTQPPPSLQQRLVAVVAVNVQAVEEGGLVVVDAVLVAVVLAGAVTVPGN
jgi:hypothetical protein